MRPKYADFRFRSCFHSYAELAQHRRNRSTKIPHIASAKQTLSFHFIEAGIIVNHRRCRSSQQNHPEQKLVLLPPPPPPPLLYRCTIYIHYTRVHARIYAGGAARRGRPHRIKAHSRLFLVFRLARAGATLGHGQADVLADALLAARRLPRRRLREDRCQWLSLAEAPYLHDALG